MIKSAHPDVALWSYESASRGYFGYHMRAKSQAARAKLHQRLVGMTASDPVLLRFGAKLEDPISAGWTRVDYPYLALTRGDVPYDGEGVRLALPDDSWPVLLALLGRDSAENEESVNAVTPGGHVPLWIWPDVA